MDSASVGVRIGWSFSRVLLSSLMSVMGVLLGREVGGLEVVEDIDILLLLGSR